MTLRPIAIFIFPLFLLPPSQAEFVGAKQNAKPGQFFVRLDDSQARWGYQDSTYGPSVLDVSTNLTAQYGGRVTAVLDGCIKGFVLQGSSREAQQLAQDFRVRRVFQDTTFIPPDKGCALACPQHPNHDPNWEPELRGLEDVTSPQMIDCTDPEPNAQTCESNWGLDRIDDRPATRDADYTFSNQGQGVHIYVVDSGIFAEHPDFRVVGSPVDRVKAGRNVYADVSGTGDPSDLSDVTCSKHGTSVASVAAGLEFGVAKQALIHPVKFTAEGGGSEVSSWIAALDWVANNFQAPAVINISSNGLLENRPGYEDLISCAETVMALGIPIVQAAGNKSDVQGDACQWTLADPANGAPGVLVAGGMDQFDSRWERDQNDPDNYLCPSSVFDCGSNTGSCVDVWAPAAHIVSAHGYDAGASNMQAVCHSSGTSFAAPHVTGVVALYLHENPGASVAEVTQALRGSAWEGLLDGSIGGPPDGNLIVNSTLNLRPTANDDYAFTGWQTHIAIPWSTLLANDEDPEGGSLSVCGVGTPEFGTIISSGGGFTTYAPPPGCLINLDTFDYTLCDDGDGQDTATVTIEIGGYTCPPSDS